MILNQDPLNNTEQQFNVFSLIPWMKIVGSAMIILALVTFGWVLFELYQLYNQGGAFLMMNGLIPESILISTYEETGKLYLPREILVYGLPLWILGLAAQIGITLLKTGSQYIDKRNNLRR